MTVLADKEIKNLIAAGKMRVDPYDENLVGSQSLDIRLGNKWGFIHPTGECFYIDKKDGKTAYKFSQMDDQNKQLILSIPDMRKNFIDPLEPESFNTQWVEGNSYILQPKEFIIVSSLETIMLPDNVCAELKGKSSLGRLGVCNSSQAGFIDGSFAGNITMELYNYSNYPFMLQTGMKIGQLVFHNTSQPETPYRLKGRYQNQEAGAGSKGVN